MERLPAGTLERELGDLLDSAGLRGRHGLRLHPRAGQAARGSRPRTRRPCATRAAAHAEGGSPHRGRCLRRTHGARATRRRRSLAAAPFGPVSILGAAGLAGRRASVFELDDAVLRRADALDAQNAVWLARSRELARWLGAEYREVRLDGGHMWMLEQRGVFADLLALR